MPRANLIKVTSPDVLRIILADGESKDFSIHLGGKAERSLKTLSMSERGTIQLYASIDESNTEYPSMDEMLEDSNIGLAIDKGCFYYETEAAMAA